MKLTVHGNYLMKDDKQFFWLGDTAWLLFEKLSLEEAKLYLENRKGLGYNVIQCVLVHTYNETGYSCAGKSPNSKIYWDEVEEIVQYAKTLDLIMGILPAWGAMVKKGFLNMENVNQYADFLNKKFKNYDNIVWILGGDIRADEDFLLYDIFGKNLKKGNSDRLITFHPFGRTGSYLWLNDCDWLDFNMFQSGHRRYDQVKLGAWDDKNKNEDSFGEDNYKYVLKNQSYSNCKPCLDAEPSYEGIVQGLHNGNEPYWEARHVRRYAYWSVFEGACGFTYGNNAVMQFYRSGDEKSYFVREEWKDAIHMPGGAQMQYLKQLFESVDFINGRARADLIINQGEGHKRVSVFKGENYIFCYSYLGEKFVLDLKEDKGKSWNGYWMNPENSSKSFLGRIDGGQLMEFKPVSRHELSNDWVLVLREL